MNTIISIAQSVVAAFRGNSASTESGRRNLWMLTAAAHQRRYFLKSRVQYILHKDRMATFTDGGYERIRDTYAGNYYIRQK